MEVPVAAIGISFGIGVKDIHNFLYGRSMGDFCQLGEYFLWS
jgi:hypothetical protein